MVEMVDAMVSFVGSVTVVHSFVRKANYDRKS